MVAVDVATAALDHCDRHVPFDSSHQESRRQAVPVNPIQKVFFLGLVWSMNGGFPFKNCSRRISNTIFCSRKWG
jgi:hypothetical protein